MKIGLLADIHGNVAALKSVLKVAVAEGVERFFVAGDLVGYYYAPDQVISELDRFDWIAVRGNHEDMLAAWRSGSRRDEFHQRYGSGLAVADAVLDDVQISRLISLPICRQLSVGGMKVLVCHGTPASTDEYVYPDAPDDAFGLFQRDSINFAFHGHTHYPHQRRLGDLLVVNAGSVGQPRNRVPGAHWALWDVEAGTVSARVEQYDMLPLVDECRRRDPHLPFLAEVLTRT